MALSVTHYYFNSMKTLCGMSHFSTTSASGLMTTTDKNKVTCKKCIAVMKKWKWNLQEK